jgi:hypothetical protein
MTICKLPNNVKCPLRSSLQRERKRELGRRYSLSTFMIAIK